jgi:hypothetical protein
MMAIVPIFRGHVDEHGALELADAERPNRRNHLRTLLNQDVEVVVRKARSQRSLDQNAYLHSVPFPILAEEWGEDIETTKLLVLGECFGWRETRDGKRLPMKPSTSGLTVEECSKLIEWLPPWALVNFRVRIPLPNEAEAG